MKWDTDLTLSSFKENSEDEAGKIIQKKKPPGDNSDTSLYETFKSLVPLEMEWFLRKL